MNRLVKSSPHHYNLTMSTNTVLREQKDHHGLLSLESLPYVHPDLAIDVTSTKGRLVTAATTINRGQVVLVDKPYALLPAMLADEPPFMLCSRHDCNRRIAVDARKPANQVACPNQCIAEVAWCSDKCRTRDAKRHAMECAWLKQTSAEIRRSHGDAVFGLLWLIARILIVRHCDEATTQTDTQRSSDRAPTDDEVSASHFGRRGWAAVWNLEGDLDSFPLDKITRWRKMTEDYLVRDVLQYNYPADDIVKLICKVETNSFGLYPGITGQYPVTPWEGRGDYYGGGIYPTAAMFNHACCPNVSTQLAHHLRHRNSSQSFQSHGR